MCGGGGGGAWSTLKSEILRNRLMYVTDKIPEPGIDDLRRERALALLSTPKLCAVSC
jgi:hypothetical protein